MAMDTTTTDARIPPSEFRGATVEDLDLPPALSIHPDTYITTALAMSYDRDYSQLTVIHPNTRALLGYVSSAALKSAAETLLKSPSSSSSGISTSDKERLQVSSVMNRFDRRRSKGYRVITPTTPLEELAAFFDTGEEFAVVTDAGRRFVLGVATKGDLMEFLRRRPNLIERT